MRRLNYKKRSAVSRQRSARAVQFNLNGLDSPQLAAQNLFPYRSLPFPHAFSGNPGDVRTRPPLETCGGDNRVSDSRLVGYPVSLLRGSSFRNSNFAIAMLI